MTNCSFRWQAFPLPWKCTALKTLLQQDLSCNHHLLVKTRCFRVESHKRQVVQVTNGKETTRVHTSRLPDKCPFHHARCLKIPSLVIGFSAFPLRKEKKKKKGKRKSQDSMILSGLSLSISPYGSEEEWERNAPGFFQRYDSTWFPSKDLEQLMRLLSPSWCRV